METKKLTCCDLMIGDWVECNGKFIQAENVHKDMINYTPDIPYVQEEDFIEEKDITPIPLTAEILEKIGFKREEEARGFSEPYCVYVNDDFQYVIKVYPKGIMDRYSRLEIGDYDDNEYMSLLINSLHELQHALRLCGIDKEINL